MPPLLALACALLELLPPSLLLLAEAEALADALAIVLPLLSTAPCVVTGRLLPASKLCMGRTAPAGEGRREEGEI